MPKFKHIAQIETLLDKKQQIRNLGIIAHIDHGKTTLADSLLAGTGLLSPQMAGSARVLDYLEEEQKRKITIKAANITLLYKAAEDNYIFNLVDTPGHVDFTGKVTRALRTIDGAVVLVDAVEEIMAQTEILTRQALQERVRPVLFINKVDRLITELQLTAPQIEQKLNHIISNFNDLVELYGEKPFKTQWKIDPAKGNVAFGSALHGWGFTVDIAKQKNIKFTDVIEAYQSGKQEQLRKALPVYQAVFQLAIDSLPDPKQAQAYRTQRIWDGTRQSKAGKAIADCNDDGFAVFCVTNVQPNEEGGSIVVGRVFSGTVKAGDKLYCVNSQTEIAISGVYLYMGSFREEIRQASAGCIAALAVSAVLKAGETLVDPLQKQGMVPFESISYVSEPVVTVAVEPKNPKEIFAFLKALHKLTTEDPNLAFSVDKETGEYLLSVMGELHLEVALNQLKDISGSVEIGVSPPRVVYRETVTKKGAEAIAVSPNRQNRFTVQVEPADAEANQLGFEEAGVVLSVDEQRNVLLDLCAKTEALTQEELQSIIAGFEYACKTGPLCAEPVRHVKVDLADLEVSPNPEPNSQLEIMHGIGKAIFGSFLTAKPVLLEPVYKTVISVPTELFGECIRIITSRRGKILGTEQKGLLTIITGRIPVAETFGLSKELRSATSGKALWQNMLDCWQQVPEKLAEKVISEVRVRKGLAPQVPSPSKFSEETT
jgi:elongation factor 2